MQTTTRTCVYDRRGRTGCWAWARRKTLDQRASDRYLWDSSGYSSMKPEGFVRLLIQTYANLHWNFISLATDSKSLSLYKIVPWSYHCCIRHRIAAPNCCYSLIFFPVEVRTRNYMTCGPVPSTRQLNRWWIILYRALRGCCTAIMCTMSLDLATDSATEKGSRKVRVQ